MRNASTSIIKIVILGSNFKPGRTHAVKYTCGVDFRLFLSQIMPASCSHSYVVFADGCSTRIDAGELDPFLPYNCYLHVLLIPADLVPPRLDRKSDLFQYLAKRAGDDAAIIRDFISKRPSNIFETAIYQITIEPCSINLPQMTDTMRQVIGVRNVTDEKVHLKWHDETEIRMVDITRAPVEKPSDQQDHILTLVVSPERSIRLLKDMAAMDEDYMPQRIQKVVEFDDHLHLAVIAESGRRELKSFRKDSSIQGETVYRDTGNRWLPIEILEATGAELSRQLIVQQLMLQLQSQTAFAGIPGEICDLYTVGPDDHLVLSWIESEKYCRVFRIVGKDAEAVREEFSFAFDIKPRAFAYSELLNLYFLAPVLKNDVYCIDRSGMETAQNITTALMTNHQHFAAGGEIQDLYAAYLTKDIPALVTVQVNAVRVFVVNPDVHANRP